MTEKEVKYDVDGYEDVTNLIISLLNSFPLLKEGKEITFSALEEDTGISMFPVSGAIVEEEKEDILGNVTQKVQYPFYVIYRASGLSETRKASVKEWLDNLGRWLELQELKIEDMRYKLSGYPDLAGTRKILSIERQTPSYLDTINENKSENWAILISARYINKFTR